MRSRGSPYLLILFFLLSGCGSILDDLTSPEVRGHYPAHNQYGIPGNASVLIQFTKPMDKTSAENGITIRSEGDTAGRFAWDSPSSVRFTLERGLTTGEPYTVLVDSEIKDTTGNTLKRDYLFTFYVSDDITVPYVVSTAPQNLAEGVARDADIYIYFSEPMNEETVRNNFTLSPDAGGVYEWDPGRTVLAYRLNEDLQGTTRYHVAVGKDAEDREGNKLGEEYRFSFLTGQIYSLPSVLGVYRYGDATLPVSARYWTNRQNGIAKNISLAVHFNRTMSRPETENAFSLSPSVSGYFTWSTVEGETMIFNSSAGFSPETLYKLSVSSSARDSDGHSLNPGYQIHFLVNGTNSSLLSITQVLDNLFNPLSFETVNEVSLGAQNTNTFTVDFNLAAPNQLDLSSFQANVSVSRFSGWGDPSYSGAIYDFFYSGDLTRAFLRLGDLSTNNYYRLKFTGGASGIRDIHGNPLKEDAEVLFLTR